MKRIFYLLITAASLFIVLSCEENFSPKGELPNKYTVNLILRGDTTFQTAYVSRLYDVQGFDPNTLKTDPAVSGAQLYIKYTDSDTRYYFRDTVDNANLNSRYNTPAKYYYLNNFKPRYGKEIEMNLILPDGKRLASKSKTPEGIYFDEDRTTPYIPGPLISFYSDSVYINVVWGNSSVNLVKGKKVSFVYYHKDLNGVTSKFVKQVPIIVEQSNGNTFTDYNALSFDNELKLERKLLQQALEEISQGDSKKGRYSIAPLVVDIYLLDENLTKLYSANLFFDFGFTVRNYPADITNIDGGLGFFSSYSVVRRVIQFDPQYLLKKYGYLSVD